MKKIILFILITLCMSCQISIERRDKKNEDVFTKGKELLISKGYYDIIATGSWPKNDQNLNARTNFQVKDKDNNIVEGYFIEDHKEIVTYIEKKAIKI